MMFLVAKLGFAFATIFFLYGFSHRHRDRKHHQRAMGLGYVLVTVVTFYVLTGVIGSEAPLGLPIIVERFLGVETGHAIQKIHMVIALLAYGLLSAQVATGLLGASPHKLLARLTAPVWIFVFVTGLLIYG